MLTSFGRILSKASRSKAEVDSSVENNIDSYNANIKLINALRVTLKKKQSVLVLGAGVENSLPSIRTSTQGWLLTGVHWNNFRKDIQMDVVTSTHVCTLEAALYSATPPLLLVHGVYSKVPPVLKRSFSLRWSDPFMPGFPFKPTAEGLDLVIRSKSVGPAPYLPSIRNTLFLNAMTMIWLGAKRIAFAGVDPHHPEYFFSQNNNIKLEIVRCLSLCDPWLAEWDGRNERLNSKSRDTCHRIQHFVKNVVSARSAVGEQSYIDEFDRGFKLLKEFADMKGVELGYFGTSSYMKTTGIQRWS